MNIQKLQQRGLLQRTLCAALFCCTSLTGSIALAQDYPSKPVTLVVSYPPGGSNDLTARAIAPALGEALGATIVIENKPGAAGMISGTYVSRAAPDGYMILLGSLSPIIVSPQAAKNPPFNTPVDFRAINRVGSTPLGIAMGPTLPNVKSIADLIAVSKTRDVTLSSAGTGGVSHLTIELLQAASKGRLVHVPYKGAGPAVTDTVAGHVDGIVMDISPLMPMMADGRLKGIAVTSAERMSFVPTLAPVGEFLPGFSAVNWLGLFVPVKTPEPIVAKINVAIIKTIARKDVREKLEAAGIMPSSMENPAAFQAYVNEEYVRWGKILQDAKIEKQD
ncbi:MAG: tripartite tricarboxylate transporter substrate binding protein [Alcaligenaceae bacterium]